MPLLAAIPKGYHERAIRKSRRTGVGIPGSWLPLGHEIRLQFFPA